MLEAFDLNIANFTLFSIKYGDFCAIFPPKKTLTFD